MTAKKKITKRELIGVEAALQRAGAEGPRNRGADWHAARHMEKREDREAHDFA